MSFAKLSQDPVDFPSFFIGIGRISLAADSSSEQHDFGHVFSFVGFGTIVFTRDGRVGTGVGRVGGRVGFVGGRVGFVGGNVGFVGGNVGFVGGSVGFVGGSVGLVAGSVGLVSGRVGIVAAGVGLVAGIVGTILSIGVSTGINGNSTILLGEAIFGGLIGGLLFLRTLITVEGIGRTTGDT